MKATDPPKLIALTGPTAGHVVELQADAMSAGREPENDIVLETQYVSRQHCRFEKTDDCFRVVDLDSHNGTSVNGIPVKERLLAPGDRISLGGASFLFVDPSAPPRGHGAGARGRAASVGRHRSAPGRRRRLLEARAPR